MAYCERSSRSKTGSALDGERRCITEASYQPSASFSCSLPRHSPPADAKTATAPARKAYTLPHLAAKAWTGDLDGMIKRRMIRVLVPYSKTLYFVDRGTQRGLLYEMFRLFERDLNKKLW